MTADPTRRTCAVAVGTFDGVHRGHRLVLDRLVRSAHRQGLCSVVVTFEPHPLRIVHPAAAPALLMTAADKHRALTATGVDEVAVVPFDAALASLEAHEFVDQVLMARFGMRELFVGHDHGFGRGRSGDAATLERLGRERGFVVHIVPPVLDRHGQPVSSSAIRRAIARGDLAAAADGLAHPFAVSGVVLHGAGRGAGLGYRTLNLPAPPADAALPPDGVYAVQVIGEAGRLGGMANLGARPTFGDERRTIEVHVFDASGDWYGQSVDVAFVARIRDVKRFTGADALVTQLKQDEQVARLRIARITTGWWAANPLPVNRID